MQPYARIETMMKTPRVDTLSESTANDSDTDAVWQASLQRMHVSEEQRAGIAIRWADDTMLHACLGDPGAPVPQGVDATASGVAIRVWFSSIVTAVSPISAMTLADGTLSSEIFHFLLLSVWSAITRVLLSSRINMVWGYELARVNLTAGKYFMVASSSETVETPFMPFRERQ